MTAKAQARSRIAAAAGQLLELSHRIHAHPETAWAEHRAAGWLTDALDRLGYTVTRGACQLPTAFTASIGTGELRIGICAEYDALPGLGHACGHNIIAAAAIGAATRDTVRDRLLHSSGPGRPCADPQPGAAARAGRRREPPRIDRSELEGQKHLLDRSITTQGGFERRRSALKDTPGHFALRSGGRDVEPRG